MHDFLATDLNLGWRFAEVKKAKKIKASFASVVMAFMLDEASIERDQHQMQKDKCWC